MLDHWTVGTQDIERTTVVSKFKSICMQLGFTKNFLLGGRDFFWGVVKGCVGKRWHATIRVLFPFFLAYAQAFAVPLV